MLHSKNKARREFIKTCLRFSIGGGLIFTGIALGLRKKADNTKSDICQLGTTCRGCLQYKGCNLPQALTVKKREGGSSGRK
jgi:hypothetical protein